MKKKELLVLLILLVISLYSYGIANTKNNEIQDSYFDSLLTIESAKKLYRKKHYDEALFKLLKVASIIKDNKIKAQAIIEIGFVKFLMGYRAYVYEVFIRKAIDLNPKIKLTIGYTKRFLNIFRNIKQNYIPKNIKKRKNLLIVKDKPKTIKDMEINNNLIFKMKKEILFIKESKKQENDKMIKLKHEILTLKQNNNRNNILINKLRKELSSLKRLKNINYKKQYYLIKKKKEETDKKLTMKLAENKAIILKLTKSIDKQNIIIKGLKQNNLASIRSNKITDKNIGKSRINVFKTLHKLWEKDKSFH